jgi:hypothetical protein
MMEAILERYAGLDVHQETVVACVLVSPLDRAPVTDSDVWNDDEGFAGFGGLARCIGMHTRFHGKC